MKIALVIERMDAFSGGREISTAQSASALAAMGHDVTIFCRRGTGRMAGVTVRELGAGGITRLGRLKGFIAASRQAARAGGYDIVHAMLPMAGADVCELRGGTICGQIEGRRRCLGRAGGIWKAFVAPVNPCRRHLGAMERHLVREGATLFLSVSRMVAEEFRQYYGGSRNIRVIYNAVAVPPADGEQRARWRQKLRSQLGVGSEDTVFVTAARNFALKGVGQTVRHFAEWFHSRAGGADARLVVVGGDGAGGYRRMAAMRGVGSKVVFAPATENMFEYYSAADACILLSWYDPCSRVVLEAVRWGVPAISTVYNGASEVLAEGAGIVVASPRDAAGVVAAMAAMADPQKRRAMAESCLRLGPRLSMDRYVQELLATYQEVVGRRLTPLPGRERVG